MSESARLVLEFAAAPLGDPDRFAARIVASNLLSMVPFVGHAQLDEANVLRDAVARALRSVARGNPVSPRDAATLNSFADEDPPRPSLREGGAIARTAAAPVPAALSAVARAAIDILVSRAADLRTCQAEGCGDVFLDESRGGRRRWCSMARCGNRAKVVAFRERRVRRSKVLAEG